MIDKVNKCEESLLKNLKEKFSWCEESQSLETQLNQIEETFRNPNHLIESIQEMQRNQEDSLKDI
jgi:hypothetical protein